MTKLIWDKIGEHYYETGTDHGVLFLQDNNGAYMPGEVWNGLTAFKSSPTGAESTPLYADNIKYLSLRANEEFKGTIEAYTYPDKFAECDGSAEIAPGVMIGQQKRKTFGFSCRTLVGNDTEGSAHAYKIHLIYGATASPSSKEYSTVNETPDAITFSWEIDSVPVHVEGFSPTSILTIDSRDADPEALKALETILYGKDPTSPNGSDGVEPRLPLPDEVAKLFAPDPAPGN